ncbi:SDR family NAD(P)-dependent oxidoreductase, partial [Pectobacterium versatile]|nr:SDR family NAD(P)-dependent oxidoreductase [Pectobacterium versatile]
EDCAHEVVERIRHSGGEVIAVQADISQEEQIVALFKQIDKDLGPVSGLVNNAGMLMPQASIEQLNAQRL